MKRKKKSKVGSKKAARKGHRQASQLPPVDTYELDMTGVPREKLEQTVNAFHRVNQGLKSSSDRAESALSGMSRMIGKMTKARNDERGWLQEENRLLKDLPCPSFPRFFAKKARTGLKRQGKRSERQGKSQFPAF